MSEERYTLAQHQEHRRRVEAQQRRTTAEREKAGAFHAWVAAGGDPSGFEEAWPQVRAERAKARVLSDDEAARAAQRSSGVSVI